MPVTYKFALRVQYAHATSTGVVLLIGSGHLGSGFCVVLVRHGLRHFLAGHFFEGDHFLLFTGKVVSILEPSPRREAIVGVLLPPATAMTATAAPAGSSQTPAAAAATAALASGSYQGYLMLVPLDPRLPKGLVTPEVVARLPEALR